MWESCGACGGNGVAISGSDDKSFYSNFLVERSYLEFGKCNFGEGLKGKKNQLDFNLRMLCSNNWKQDFKNQLGNMPFCLVKDRVFQI